MTNTQVNSANASKYGLLKSLWVHILPQRRKQFAWLLTLMLVSSIAELASISAVLPFLGVLTSPERMFGHAALQPLVQLLDLKTPESLLIPLTILFGLAALLASAIRLLLLWVSTRLAFATGADLGLAIFRRTLYQPYSVHISRNSSTLIDAVCNKSQGVIGGVIYPVVVMVSSGLMLVIIVGALIFYQPLISILSFAGFGCLYFLISRLTRSRLLANSEVVATQSTKRVKALQEGIGGIRDLLLDGTQPAYCAIFNEADRKMRRAQAQNSFFNQSPRYLMEVFGMIIIATFATWVTLKSGEFSSALPTMGILALAAQRLLPMMQQFYQGWSSFKGNNGTLIEILELLEQPLSEQLIEPPKSPISFTCEINLEAVAFRYTPTSSWVLNDVSFKVPKGSRVGVIGTTGSGKSTLIDIILGLLLPTHGHMFIDGVAIDHTNARSWQARLAHVPQSIYLADASITQNIAFGVPPSKIDMIRVKQAANQAQLTPTIEAFPFGYETRVGERGVQLSGGQRQRIGIARALYKKSDVIILDEATSALDNATEEAVMRAIDGLERDITLFIIAHRLTTLSNCDFIIDVNNGKAGVKLLNKAAINAFAIG